MYDFYNNHIEVDYKQLLLTIDNLENIEMTAVYNEELANAYNENLIYFDCNKNDIINCLKQPIYICARDIMNRQINGLELYMDFLIYNNDESVLPKGTVNRSLGHRNDINEFEVHQVINGTVFSIFKLPNDELYFGIFKSGDYFEIPAGAFHCTYILEGPAVVVNFYCNAYWGNDMTNKPYFMDKNNITVERHGDKFIVKFYEKGVIQEFSLETFADLKVDGFNEYKDFYHNGILKNHYADEEKSIFSLFYSPALQRLKDVKDYIIF